MKLVIARWHSGGSVYNGKRAHLMVDYAVLPGRLRAALIVLQAFVLALVLGMAGIAALAQRPLLAALYGMCGILVAHTIWTLARREFSRTALGLSLGLGAGAAAVLWGVWIV